MASKIATIDKNLSSGAIGITKNDVQSELEPGSTLDDAINHLNNLGYSETSRGLSGNNNMYINFGKE